MAKTERKARVRTTIVAGVVTFADAETGKVWASVDATGMSETLRMECATHGIKQVVNDFDNTADDREGAVRKACEMLNQGQWPSRRGQVDEQAMYAALAAKAGMTVEQLKSKLGL